MARGVIAWLGAALVACLVVGSVYLPPRGMPRWAWASRMPILEATAARAKANALASEWRKAQAAVVAARYRDRLGPMLALRRAEDRPGPLLVAEAPDSVLDRAEPIMRRALDSAWARLGIGVSKVSVAVVLGLRGPANPSRNTIDAGSGQVAYVLPDSTNRAVCIATGRIPFFAATPGVMRGDQMLRWAASTLGPCAFYARFGVPGQRVERWLGQRGFDVAVSASWFGGSPPDRGLAWLMRGLRPGRWWWGGLYALPFSTVACLAGREEVCRRDLTAGDAAQTAARPGIVVPPDPWDARKTRLVGAERFLADVMHAVGEDRFQEFWTTSLPVDSALTLALHRPVGEWTVEWQRRMLPPPPLGAGVRPLDAALGVALVLLMLSLVMMGQIRREVR